MLSDNKNINFLRIDIDQAKILAKFAVSAIGHADTATVASQILGEDFAQNRQTVSFSDNLLVVQYKGDRLEEGTTKLPENSTLECWLVTSENSFQDALKLEQLKSWDHQAGAFHEFDPYK